MRTRLVAVVAVAVGLALAATTAGFNLILANRLSHDADTVVRTRATAELSELLITNHRLVLHEAPDQGAVESPVWIFVGRRALERPRATPGVNAAAERLAVSTHRRKLDVGSRSRLYVLPVVHRNRRYGTVVAAVALAPYQHTARIALIASLLLAVVLFAGVILVARSAVSVALRPVARMTAQAAEWSEHDLDRRFDVGPPRDELTQLAATLDGLLARLAASLRREQRFSAEVSHELRTPLSRIAAEAELALSRGHGDTEEREALRRVLDAVREVSRTVETLVAVAREDARLSPAVADPADAARQAAQACEGVAKDREVSVAVASNGSRLRVGADSDVLERLLVPVIENACHHADGSVTVSVRRDTTKVRIDVRDDGPGLAPAEVERVFEPGYRGGEEGDRPGAGLGLALARRLARAAGGDMEAEPGPGGKFSVILPAA